MMVDFNYLKKLILICNTIELCEIEIFPRLKTSFNHKTKTQDLIPKTQDQNQPRLETIFWLLKSKFLNFFVIGAKILAFIAP